METENANDQCTDRHGTNQLLLKFSEEHHENKLSAAVTALHGTCTVRSIRIFISD